MRFSSKILLRSSTFLYLLALPAMAMEGNSQPTDSRARPPVRAASAADASATGGSASARRHNPYLGAFGSLYADKTDSVARPADGNRGMAASGSSATTTAAAVASAAATGSNSTDTQRSGSRSSGSGLTGARDTTSGPGREDVSAARTVSRLTAAAASADTVNSSSTSRPSGARASSASPAAAAASFKNNPAGAWYKGTYYRYRCDTGNGISFVDHGPITAEGSTEGSNTTVSHVSGNPPPHIVETSLLSSGPAPEEEGSESEYSSGTPASSVSGDRVPTTAAAAAARSVTSPETGTGAAQSTSTASTSTLTTGGAAGERLISLGLSYHF